MSVTIVEAQIVDHPDYETYEETFNEVEDALAYCKGKIQEDIDFDGEGGAPIVKKVGKNGQYRVSSEEGYTVYFVTVVEPK